jgi:hypothetical protein
MTTAQAGLLQTKWKQQGDPPPACPHALQELASSDLDQGYVLNTYHCRDCGELIVHRFKPKTFSNSPLMEPDILMGGKAV